MAKSAIKNVAVERQGPTMPPASSPINTTFSRFNRPANDNYPLNNTVVNRGVRNVERETWTDSVQRSKTEPRSDNISKVSVETVPKRVGLAKRTLNPKKLASKVKQRTQAIKKTASSAQVATNIITATWWNLGLLQLIGGTLYLLGLMWIIMSEETIIAYIDFVDIAVLGGEMLAYAGLTISFICGFMLLIIGILTFTARQISVIRSWSILVMVICLIMHAVPAISLIPGMYLWYLYVVTSQVRVK